MSCSVLVIWDFGLLTCPARQRRQARSFGHVEASDLFLFMTLNLVPLIIFSNRSWGGEKMPGRENMPAVSCLHPICFLTDSIVQMCVQGGNAAVVIEYSMISHWLQTRFKKSLILSYSYSIVVSEAVRTSIYFKCVLYKKNRKGWK